jgi:glycosyltransferase involved in cell wall biosynthesis
MRILHIENQAGVPHSIAIGQRQIGHEALVLETYPNFLNEPHDLEMFYGPNIQVVKNLRNAIGIVKLARSFDIVHLHGGVHWKRFDAVAIKRILNKPMVVHYHGSETRLGYGLSYKNLWKVKIVSRPDLLEWLPDARFIKSPIAGITKKELPDYPLKILHMYHNPTTKGSSSIVKVLESLKKEGVDLEYNIIVKQPHSEALRAISSSHIVVDQFLDRKKNKIPSIIGMVSLEAMAMGRGVISTMDKEYRKYYPGCPVVYCEPDEEDLAKRIIEYVDNKDKLHLLVNSSAEYVQKEHSPLEVAKLLDKIYEEAK